MSECKRATFSGSTVVFLRIAKINDVFGFGALIWAKMAFNRPHRVKTYRQRKFKPSFKDAVSVVVCS